MVPEFAIAVQLAQEQATPLRVVTLGTSHTSRGRWQVPLARALTSCRGTTVNIVNRGKSGANSDWGLGQIPEIAAARPDVVTIEFSANDASLHGGVTFATARNNIMAMVRELRAKVPGVRIILMAMNPMSGLRGALRPSLDRYDDLYRDVAKELHVDFIDLRPVWRSLGESALSAAIPDGVHPNVKDEADIVVPALARAICTSRGEHKPS